MGARRAEDVSEYRWRRSPLRACVVMALAGVTIRAVLARAIQGTSRSRQRQRATKGGHSAFTVVPFEVAVADVGTTRAQAVLRSPWSRTLLHRADRATRSDANAADRLATGARSRASALAYRGRESLRTTIADQRDADGAKSTASNLQPMKPTQPAAIYAPVSGEP